MGRKRKPHRREPNGRVKRKSRREMKEDAVRVMVDARRRKYPDVREKDLTHPLMEMVVGVMALGGRLGSIESPEDRERVLNLAAAGVEYQRRFFAYHRAILGLREPIGGGESPSGEAPSIDPDLREARMLAIRRAWEEMDAVVKEAGAAVPVDIVCRQNLELSQEYDSAIRRGLEAAWSYWKETGREWKKQRRRFR